MCNILNHEKTILNNLEYFGGKFLNLGAFFSVRGKFVREKFSVWENLKSLLWGEFYFGVLFSVWANLCMGNPRYLF